MLLALWIALLTLSAVGTAGFVFVFGLVMQCKVPLLFGEPHCSRQTSERVLRHGMPLVLLLAAMLLIVSTVGQLLAGL